MTARGLSEHDQIRLVAFSASRSCISTSQVRLSDWGGQICGGEVRLAFLNQSSYQACIQESTEGDTESDVITSSMATGRTRAGLSVSLTIHASENNLDPT